MLLLLLLLLFESTTQLSQHHKVSQYMPLNQEMHAPPVELQLAVQPQHNINPGAPPHTQTSGSSLSQGSCTFQDSMFAVAQRKTFPVGGGGGTCVMLIRCVLLSQHPL